MIKLAKGHRDRIYIRKDILLKLYDSGEMNQSRLLSECGLNNSKHKEILEDLAKNGFIEHKNELEGKKSISKYKITQKGIEILNEIFERYELLFPRGDNVES